MISPRIITMFFKRESLLKIYMSLMGLGIIILVDSLATMWVASKIGAYLSLALVGISTWGNLGIIFMSLSKHLRIVKISMRTGTLDEREFVHAIGLTLSAICMIIPGFLTDILGWLLYIYPVRMGVGYLFYKRYHREFQQAKLHMSTEI